MKRSAANSIVQLVSHILFYTTAQSNLASTLFVLELMVLHALRFPSWLNLRAKPPPVLGRAGPSG